jgi:hypothetical protein
MMIMSFDVSQTTTINGGGNDDDDNDREGKLIANSFSSFSTLLLPVGGLCDGGRKRVLKNKSNMTSKLFFISCLHKQESIRKGDEMGIMIG